MIRFRGLQQTFSACVRLFRLPDPEYLSSPRPSLTNELFEDGHDSPASDDTASKLIEPMNRVLFTKESMQENANEWTVNAILKMHDEVRLATGKKLHLYDPFLC